MCGIAGIVDFNKKSPSRKEVLRMATRLRHRGPDAIEAVQSSGAALAHTRLSIIDPAGGRQPMQSEDGRFTLTFNGEIFNYREIRTRLRALGYRFRTQSDTEVLLTAFRHWGERCVEHLNGQWAFAVWDRERRTLFLSRDRLGIRPLHYTQVGKRFLFASEVKALFADASVPREIDPVGLDQVFTFWTPLAPRTVFRGIQELPPGCNLTVRDGKVETRSYWRPNYSGLRVSGAPISTDADTAAEELLDLLLDATRLRLRADVPVGVYVSGGLDSSVNAALVRELADGPIRAFSIEFQEKEFDESEFQRELAASLRLDRSVVNCTNSEIGDHFVDTIRHTERPVLRTAPAPMQLLSGLVRESGFKVVLTGEGADEVFGGYDIFKEAKARAFWAADPGSELRKRVFTRLYPYMPRLHAQSQEYLAAFFHATPEAVAHPFFSHLPRWEVTSRAKQFYSDDLKATLSEHDAYAELETSLPLEFFGWDSFRRAEYLETTLLLPGYILASQGDRMAMAHGVEGRYPMLDHRVFEFAAALPARMKMRGLKEKWLLKRAVGKLVPQSIARRPKQPYRAPDAKSFIDDRNGTARFKEFVEEALSEKRLRETGLFDPDAVGALCRKVLAGRAPGVKDNMAFVGILSTQILAETFLDATSADAERPTPIFSEIIQAPFNSPPLESVE